MRDSYDQFEAAGVTIAAVSKDDAEDVNEYWNENSIPFACLPDPDSKLGKLYHQQSQMGPLPAVFVISQKGIVLLAHYGDGMKDIPTVETLLQLTRTSSSQ